MLHTTATATKKLIEKTFLRYLESDKFYNKNRICLYLKKDNIVSIFYTINS